MFIVSSPCHSGNWGGICSKHTTLRNGRASTLNTGLVTVQNYGHSLPSRLVQLTLAHELGHSLGSPVSRHLLLYSQNASFFLMPDPNTLLYTLK